MTIACIIIANVLLGCIGEYLEWVDQRRRLSVVEVMQMTVPGMMASELVSVQPMNGQVGKIFELKFRKNE